MSEKKNKRGFWSELIYNNPVFGLFLGICSTLAISTNLNNALGMGLSVIVVLVLSNIIVSLVAPITPDDIHIPVYIIIIATLVTIVSMFLQAYASSLYTALGAFLDLIVVNCIILGRAEAFASKHSVAASAVDGVTQGLGYTAALVVMCIIRELLGNGTFGGGVLSADGIRIIAEPYPALMMILPVGGFLTLGCLIAFSQWLIKKLDDKEKEAAAK